MTTKPLHDPQTINGEQVLADSSEWGLSAVFPEHSVLLSSQHSSLSQHGEEERKKVNTTNIKLKNLITCFKWELSVQF